MQAYCTGCRKKVEVLSPVVVKSKNGVLRVKGFCPKRHKVSVFTNQNKSSGVLTREIGFP
jgi:hypothetical protein